MQVTEAGSGVFQGADSEISGACEEGDMGEVQGGMEQSDGGRTLFVEEAEQGESCSEPVAEAEQDGVCVEEDRFSKIEAIAAAAEVFVTARYNLDFFKTSQQAGIEVVGTLAEHERTERLAYAQLKGVIEA